MLGLSIVLGALPDDVMDVIEAFVGVVGVRIFHSGIRWKDMCVTRITSLRMIQRQLLASLSLDMRNRTLRMIDIYSGVPYRDLGSLVCELGLEDTRTLDIDTDFTYRSQSES